MAVYTKSFATDFGSALDISQFHYEIEDDSTIVTALTGVTRKGDVIDIEFTGALSGAEVAQLDVLVGSHTPATPFTYNKRIIVTPKKTNLKNTGYTRVGAFHYDGSRYEGPIKRITVEAYKNANAASYEIRILDEKKNLVIAENSFTNETEDAVLMTPLSNLPQTKTKIEIHAKVTKASGNPRVYLENINFYI